MRKIRAVEWVRRLLSPAFSEQPLLKSWGYYDEKNQDCLYSGARERYG